VIAALELGEYLNISISSVHFVMEIDSISLKVSVDLEREWYEIRDVLLGLEEKEQDVVSAFDMAADSKHPLAVWMTSLRTTVDSWHEEDAFNSCKDTNPLALCLSAMLHRFPKFGGWENERDRHCYWQRHARERHEIETKESLLLAATLGCAFAQAQIAESLDRQQEGVEWAEKAAAQGERVGLYLLGKWMVKGDANGCKKDRRKAVEYLWRAAELGSKDARSRVFKILEKRGESKRFTLLLKMKDLSKDDREWIVAKANYIVRLFKRGEGRASDMFEIGRVVKKLEVSEEKDSEEEEDSNDKKDKCKQAVLFYKLQLRACRLAIDTFTRIARCFRVPKDIRNMIAKIIWETRGEANFTKIEVNISSMIFENHGN
jgi:hypothetical protein